MTAKLTRREFGMSSVALLGSYMRPQILETEASQLVDLLYVDLHVDTPGRLLNEGLNLSESLPYTHVDIPKMRQGGLTGGFFAVSTPARSQTPLSAVKNALRITDVIVEEVARHPNDLFLASTSGDVRRASREDRVAILIGIEGGHMIDSSLEVLRQFYRLGARYMGLTHSGNTPWVGSAEYDDGPDGLTDFGRKVVREMNRLGMMVDLSHASDRAFFDAIDASNVPILNTHAACRSVSNHPRNLSDDMLKALAQNGGVLGVAYYAGMLDDKFRNRMSELREINRQKGAVRRAFAEDKRRLSEELWKLEVAGVELIGQVPLSRLVDHIEHAATAAGIDHVGVGCDYDSVGLRVPEGLEHIGKTPNLVAALRARGFSDEDVGKVMGGNVLRVMRQAEGAAE
ncbi:MAG: membrane dipeptidase [Acidobacteria bacterium]|nr:membrane dipeptidase [Acidobacteriota bacterium]